MVTELELMAALSFCPMWIRKLVAWTLLAPIVAFGLVGFVLGFIWLGLKTGARFSRDFMDNAWMWAYPPKPAAYACDSAETAFPDPQPGQIDEGPSGN